MPPCCGEAGHRSVLPGRTPMVRPMPRWDVPSVPRFLCWPGSTGRIPVCNFRAKKDKPNSLPRTRARARLRILLLVLLLVMWRHQNPIVASPESKPGRHQNPMVINRPSVDKIGKPVDRSPESNSPRCHRNPIGRSWTAGRLRNKVLSVAVASYRRHQNPIAPPGARQPPRARCSAGRSTYCSWPTARGLLLVAYCSWPTARGTPG